MTRKKFSKYHARKTVVEGITFDSQKEARRFIDLRELQRQGIISDLELQKPYLLIPQHREPDVVGPRGGVRKGRVITTACYYYADFVYTDERTGERIVEDCKGMRTEVYKLKKKMLYDKYGILIKET